MSGIEITMYAFGAAQIAVYVWVFLNADAVEYDEEVDRWVSGW